MTQHKSADAGFAPGPWVVEGSHVYAPDGAIIATVSNPGAKSADYPLVANRDLIAAAPALYAAAAKVLAGLNARIDAADPSAVPVFTGIVELHDALSSARGES